MDKTQIAQKNCAIFLFSKYFYFPAGNTSRPDDFSGAFEPEKKDMKLFHASPALAERDEIGDGVFDATESMLSVFADAAGDPTESDTIQNTKMRNVIPNEAKNAMRRFT